MANAALISVTLSFVRTFGLPLPGASTTLPVLLNISYRRLIVDLFEGVFSGYASVKHAAVVP